MRAIHRSFIPLILVLGIGTVGCEAFNDHPQEQEMMQLAIAAQPEAPAEEVVAPSETPIVGAVDYSTDTSQCVQSSSLTVKAAETAVTESSGWTTSGEKANAITVERIGAYTLQIAIAKLAGDLESTTDVIAKSDVLTFTIKQTGDKEYVACSVAYAASGTDYTLTGGTITVDQFDKKAEGSTLGIGANSGTYSLTFAPSTAATASAAVMLGARAATAATLLEGTYVSAAQ